MEKSSNDANGSEDDINVTSKAVARNSIEIKNRNKNDSGKSANAKNQIEIEFEDNDNSGPNLLDF